MMNFSKIASRSFLYLTATATLALTGCATTEPISSKLGFGPAESAEQAGLYETSASPAAAFNAAKVASSRLTMATIATADPDIGLIQVKRGAAKTINILVKPGANHGKTTVKIDVANMAGIYALFDPNTDTSDIVNAMKEVLGVPVTLAGQNKARAPENADHTPAVEEVRASADPAASAAVAAPAVQAPAPKAAATQPAKAKSAKSAKAKPAK